MLKQKIPDLLIVILAVIVVGLLSALALGVNRMTAQAAETERLQGETPKGVAVPALGAILSEDRAGEVTLTYQDVFTETNMPAPSQDPWHPEGEGVFFAEPDGVNRAGIGAQSTNSGSEFVPSSAFRHDGISLAHGYRFSPVDGGYIRNNVNNASMCIAAPVYLPHGSTFSRFFMYFVDEDPVREMDTAQLVRRKLSHPVGTASELVADLDFLGNPSIDINSPFMFEASSSIVITEGSEAINNNYSYFIIFCFAEGTGFDHRIYGFRVDYDS
jgi:hypothetical protein